MPTTMAKLALDQAPPPNLPRRFLLTSAGWGVVAGAMLLADGDSAVLSRWAPATLALVHAFTLGVLGNAMFGSLLQFLPAAAGVRVRGGMTAGRVLYGLLNAGVIALLVGLRFSHPRWLLVAGGCLVGAFVLLAAMTLPGLVRAQAQRLLRAGIAMAVVAGVTTAGLGAAMLPGLSGAAGGLALLPWANTHAAWGVLGWVLVLLASVAQVVMPMFQGTVKVRPAAQLAWLAAAVVGLLLGSAAAAWGHDAVLRWFAATCAAAFALTSLGLQWRAKRTRNVWLQRCWRAGLLALLAAAIVLAGDGPATLVGVLAIGIGLPLLVAGMQLEIVAFLGWIELHRVSGRGVQLPGVQLLLPDADKARVLVLHLGAGALLLAAVLWPQPALARLAGAALAVAYGALYVALQGVRRRSHHFLRSREAIA